MTQSFCLLAVTITTIAGRAEPTPPADAVWVMKYDDKLDGEVKAKPGGEVRWRVAARNDRLAGSLADLKEGDPKDHKLAGELAAGKTPIVHLRQDGPGGLTCYYTGKLLANDRIAGTWYDNRGSSGDFEMTVEKK
jgi:hypothetical protein